MLIINVPLGGKVEKSGVGNFRGWSGIDFPFVSRFSFIPSNFSTDLHSWGLERGLMKENFTEQDLPSTIFSENGWDSIQDIQTIQASIEALLDSGRGQIILFAAFSLPFNP